MTPETTFTALVIAPKSMLLTLTYIIQGRCAICSPGHALTGRGFNEIYAFGGEWELEPGMDQWLDSVRQRFNHPGQDIRWIR